MPELISGMRYQNGRIDVRATDEFHRLYLRADFFAEYDPCPVAIPLGIALIPFVANVAPALWLSGELWSVPELDAEFVGALDDLKEVFAGWYPSLSWSGGIIAQRPSAGRAVREPTGDHDAAPTRLAVLFSGGVDSMYASLTYRSERQRLVTVWGNGLAMTNSRGFSALRRRVEGYADFWGHEPFFVRSNLREFLNVGALESRWPEMADWWERVQHGLGLIGMTAPVVPRGVEGRVVIASTRTPGWPHAHGSSPFGDQLIRWDDVVVEHQGFEVGRLEKLSAVVSVLDEAGSDAILHVCFSDRYGVATNCGRCEKCLRTAAGALIAGGLHRLGFPSRAKMVRRIRRRFARWGVPVIPAHLFFWREISAGASALTRSSPARLAEDPALREFVDWLMAFDFDRYWRRWRWLQAARGRLVRLARRSRRIESGLHRARSMWLRATSGRGRMDEGASAPAPGGCEESGDA